MLNKYFEENYNKLKDIAYNITNGKGDDLLSFVIEELYKCDKDRIIEIIKKKQLTFYIVRVMLNQYHSKTSRYYYKYNKYYEYHVSGIIEAISPDNTTSEIESNEEIEQSLEWIEENLKDLYWFDADCFSIYFRESHSLNTMSKATKISRATLYKAINNAKKHLINER